MCWWVVCHMACPPRSQSCHNTLANLAMPAMLLASGTWAAIKGLSHQLQGREDIDWSVLLFKKLLIRYLIYSDRNFDDYQYHVLSPNFSIFSNETMVTINQYLLF